MPQGKSVEPIGFSTDKQYEWALYEHQEYVRGAATFNDAVGWLYRAQPFGETPKLNVFDVQRVLRHFGAGTVKHRTVLAFNRSRQR